MQPRIRLTRSFDQRHHSYLGYVLALHGTVGDETEPRDFLIAIGEAAHEKHRFRIGDEVSGDSAPVWDHDTETAEFYKTARIAFRLRAEPDESEAPWHDLAPALETYRARGHRRLAAKTYETKCSTCIYGARMAVEIIVDHWDPDRKKYRVETFCYGPKSCPLYVAGPPRHVPGRKGMKWTEEDWVDQDATAHRGPDD